MQLSFSLSLSLSREKGRDRTSNELSSLEISILVRFFCWPAPKLLFTRLWRVYFLADLASMPTLCFTQNINTILPVNRLIL